MSSPRPNLKLDWCSHEAAKFAVERWHYSKSLPTPPLVKIGVWEGGRYIGCVLFSRGANKNLGSAFGLKTTEVCELTRVALTEHQTPVSRIVAVAIKMLRKRAPGLQLVVSFADPGEGHHGGIYQAGNWLYLGRSSDSSKFKTSDGRVWHPRQVSVSGVKRQYGTLRRVPKLTDCLKIASPGKHRYGMPLDEEMREKLAPLAKPYPKRACESAEGGTSVPTERGGSTPTHTLEKAA